MAVFAFDGIIINYIVNISAYGYGSYFEDVSAKYETMIVWTVNTFFVLVLFCMNKEKNYILNKYRYDIFIFFMVTVFSVLALKMSAFARLAGFFSINIIYLIPNLMSSIRSKYNQLYYASLILALCVCYLFRLSINNIGNTMPYIFY